jgi:hypothetical protein
MADRTLGTTIVLALAGLWIIFAEIAGEVTTLFVIGLLFLVPLVMHVVRRKKKRK